MFEILDRWEAQAVIGFAAIGMVIAVGLYIVSKFRGAADEDQIKASEMLTKFREMHSQGELSDEEYRTIKARLKPELAQQLKDSDNKV